jgi:DNA-binding transcriptional ArsR family regulator
MQQAPRLELVRLERLQAAAECLKTLAHPVRLRMVQMMLHAEYTVGEMAEACEVASHVASEHLRLMQHCGFLSRRQDGRRIYYQVAEPSLVNIMTCVVSRFGSPET